MSDAIEIQPSGPVHGSIRPPGSKSITNRALVCAALAEGTSVLTGALRSDDTRLMIEGLRALGVAVECEPSATTIQVCGCGGRLPARQADIPVGNSGTTVRFLTAVATLGQGTFRLDGIARMRERPIQDLLDALGQLGADAKSELGSGLSAGGGAGGGFARRPGHRGRRPLQPVPQRLADGCPGAAAPVELAIAGRLVSKPYIDMTLAVMGAFGVAVAAGPPWQIAPGTYRACRYAIEPDASAASYFLAAAAVTRGAVTIEGLSRQSLQGDVAFCDCLEQMGCQVRGDAGGLTVVGGPLRGIEVDMNAISDTVPTLAVVALLARGPTTIRGVAHIRHKETDRIRALATELRKLGAAVEELDDGLRIIPGTLRGADAGHLRRSPHGDEFGLGGPGHAGGGHSRPRLHGEDVSGVLRRPGEAKG